MPTVPACRSLGRHCRALQVTLRVAELDEDDATFRDDIATWLLGHTERLAFGRLRIAGRRLVVNAVIQVPCRYLETTALGARCSAHGFTETAGNGERGTANRSRGDRPQLVHRDGTVTLIHDGRRQTLRLPSRPRPRRSLPMLKENPCAGAACRTADNTQGAACCRDLTLDVVLPAYEIHTEALLETRKTPFLCKVTRVSEDMVECELISACGYLEADAVSCALHDRLRHDGSPAKPSVCREWPDLDDGDDAHTGCRLVSVP